MLLVMLPWTSSTRKKSVRSKAIYADLCNLHCFKSLVKIGVEKKLMVQKIRRLHQRSKEEVTALLVTLARYLLVSLKEINIVKNLVPFIFLSQ